MSQLNNARSISRVIDEFRPGRLLPSLAVGLVAGIITVMVEISFAALIFAGDLSSFVSNGIGLMLFGAVVIGVAVALMSSHPGIVAAPKDIPAAILALVAAAIADSMAETATAEEIFSTIVVAIAITSFSTGIFFMALGHFRLGGLIRFIPYPVVGGFLAGTGWLLVKGALGVMTDSPPTIAQLPNLFETDMLARWMPGLLFAFVLLGLLKRYDHFLIMPGMLVGATALFYVTLWLANVPVAEASARGWLLGPFPEGALWQPVAFSDLARVNWLVLFGQLGNIATVLIISVVTLLLYATGLELTFEQDIDLNRELQAAGLGTLIAGFGGGMVGYHTLSLSALSHKMGARSRLVGLITAGLCLIALFVGSSVLSFFPKVVVGGLLLMLGLSFLIEWVYETWSKFPRIDYLIILLILGVIGGIGFLQGVGVGLVAAVIMFVVNYSRINVVKHALSGANYQSRVTRSITHRRILHESGEQLYILQLQGFIFFGTADNLLGQVRRRLGETDLRPLRFVVLDFCQVTGLDSTALLSFAKMKQLVQAQDICLVFTNLSPTIRHQLEQGGFAEEIEGLVRVFRDLDHGLEWCEDQMLQIEAPVTDEEHRGLQAQLEELLPGPVHIGGLLKYFEKRQVDAGYYLMKQGDPPDDLYFIETGQVTARVEHPGHEPVRLETMQGGRVVGEIGFYLGSPRTAAVVADEPSTIYCLSRDALQQMESSDPEAASTFHQIIVHLVGERLTHLINTVHALER